MKNNLKIAALVTMAVLLFAACKEKDPMQTPSKVQVKAVDGKYNFYVNGKLFELKGAGGGGRLALLHKSGGNSVRSWSSGNGTSMLDTAYKYNLMVAMGLGMGQELHGFNYDDTAAVGKQYRRNIAAVEMYKNHPSLLCWVVGNELNLSPNRGLPVNPKVYDALKDIVDYIHKEDPNHPVTTTFAGASKEHIRVALERCPDLDFISLQVYGALARMPEIVKAAELTKPFAITEYGPVGHWEMPRTEWGREIEEPSAKKAAGIYDRIQKGIVEDPTGLCLGGYVFLWGQKQERTPTWYGMFLKSGEATAVVDELTRYWSGKYPENRAPKVDSLKIEVKNAVDNIYLKPGIKCTVKVFASDPNNDPLTIKWVMLKEVIERSQGGAREIEPDGVTFETVSDIDGELVFVSPKEEGEYRLFAYVYDGKDKAGTANVPFYVKK
ncbi:MAG: hypothetical protein MUO72_16835 [Bacteroidales bacterium]|nr:hypothetical protein [Bacteroidales bacterium]